MKHPIRVILPTLPASRWQHIWSGFLSDKLAVLSLLIFVFYCLFALAAPLIAPYDVRDASLIELADAEIAPYWISGDSRFWLGTDAQGRDMLSVILYGTRLSLTIGLGAVFIQATLGICLGLVSGYFGGRLDSLLMRCADIQLSFSTMMVAIIVMALFQTLFGMAFYQQFAMLMLIFVIGLAEWPLFARTVRASVLAERQQEYVDAARIMGIGSRRIMFKHILPNTMSSLLVIFTIQIANAIVAEAALSFLGLGIPVTQPSLGSLIADGFNYLFMGAWWICLLPSATLILLILVMNLLGDWLRDHLNPRMYQE